MRKVGAKVTSRIKNRAKVLEFLRRHDEWFTNAEICERLNLNDIYKIMRTLCTEGLVVEQKVKDKDRRIYKYARYYSPHVE